jgi:hypothetical protein
MPNLAAVEGESSVNSIKNQFILGFYTMRNYGTCNFYPGPT